MKNNFRLSVLVFIIFFCLSIPGLNAKQESIFDDPEVNISMDFQDARLKDVLKVFSIQSGLNFIASEAVQDRTITLYLDKVPLKATMDKLFKANNLSYELDRAANIFLVTDWGKPQIETVTKIFYLKYATVSSSSLKEEMSIQIPEGGGGGGGGGGKWAVEGEAGITTAVKKLLSTHGMVIEDYRTNSLLVTDIPSRMPIIAKTIAALDVPVPQVMLEVEMLDVSKNVVDKLGFDLGNNPFTIILPGSFAQRGAQFFIGNVSDRKRSLDTTAEGKTILGSIFAETLDFLRTRTDTKYLARPRLLTLNNETAEIKITTQESVGVSTTVTEAGVTTATPERVETGVSLRVTPQINLETGEVTMFIYPKVSEATAGNTLTSGNSSFIYRDPEERSTKSVVRIKDGETVIIGGLIRNELSQVDKKVPILGDIPILGMLFRHKGGTSDKNKERELLVFITPRIIKEQNIELAQVKKATLPNREQTTTSMLSRQTIINRDLNAFERIKK